MLFIWLVVLGLFFLHLYQYLRLKNRPPLLYGAWPIVGHSFMAFGDLQNLIENECNDNLRRGVGAATVRLGAWDITVTGVAFLSERLLASEGSQAFQKLRHDGSLLRLIAPSSDLTDFYETIIDPEDCLLVANACLTKDSLYDLLKPFFGEGLITANGSKWLSHRRLLSPCFNQQVLDGYLCEFNNGAKELIRTFDKEVGKGPFDHYSYLECSILSTVCVTTIGSVKDEEDKHIKECFMIAKIKFYDCLIQRVVKFWYQSDLIYTLSGLRRQEAVYARAMNELSRAILKKKKAEFNLKKMYIEDSSKTRFKSLMEHLLESSEQGHLSDQDVTDQVNTFIAAASDTISVALPNVLLCVGTYRMVQQRIIEELQSVFKGSDRDVEKQDLPQLKYMEAVIKETMRLYPSVPLIGRTLDNDLQITNYTLPAGSNCYLALYGLLRHPTWGSDAAQFRPERWLDGSLPSNHKVFAAFGIGRRSCVGINFTIMLMKTYLATILRKFTVSGDVTQLVQTFEILSRPVSGHHISIVRRV